MSQSIAETGNTQIITFILLQTYGTILSSSVKTKVVGRWWAMRLYCHLWGYLTGPHFDDIVFPGCWHFDIVATCILDDVLQAHVELTLLLVLDVLL